MKNQIELTKEQEKAVIDRLCAYVTENAEKVDVEQAYSDMLDDCYSFREVGGPFASMSPSRVLQECDPVAFRCGVSDHADAADFIEIAGDYYQERHVEEQRDAFVDSLDSELMEVNKAIESAENEPERDSGQLGVLQEKAARLAAEIETARDYVF